LAGPQQQLEEEEKEDPPRGANNNKLKNKQGLSVMTEKRRNGRSQFPRFRPQSCKNEISEISPMQECKITPVAGLNLLPGKVSDSPNFFLNFFFPNFVLLCLFLGLWSGFINPPHCNL